MRAYYEDLWEQLGDERSLPDLARRLAFLRAHVHAGERVLDLGCGAGELTAEIAALGAEPVGVEVAEAAVAGACRLHPDLDFRLTGVDQPLSFGNNGFDVVWASEVIEHVADTGLWLGEARRVLAPGGRLLLTTPAHGRLRLLVGGIEAFSPPLGDHLHLYAPASLRRLLDAFQFVEPWVRSVGGPPLLRRMLLARALKPSG